MFIKLKITLILMALLIGSSTIAQSFRVLVFSKTEGFTHASIPDGIAAIKQLGIDNDFEVDDTVNASVFTLLNLQRYDAVIFLHTTGDILDAAQQAEFEKYIQAGGGYVGIHAASDTEYSWPWYGELVGAYFKDHPAIQNATIEIADKLHPSTESLPEYWQRTDEWYNFRNNPRGNVHVLATLDESTYNGGDMGYDHPIAWCHTYDGGRAWYTGLGHTRESFSDPDFLNHVLGGISYASGAIVGDFDPTVDSKFTVQVVDDNPVNPMQLTVLPDLSVVYIEREGAIKLKDVDTDLVTTIAILNVDAGREDGLIGIVLDPDFETNNWLYLFYSPNDVSENRVSRFEMINKTINLASETILLRIPTQRQQCCHSGGDLEFDGNGNLYITVGDNINPFQSDGFAPIDERSGRSAYDAQGTSGNTQDLRGKILRIHPEPNGTYTIPAGNLFTDINQGKPEIYIMGTRNPFRVAVNTVNNEIVWGDIGPDARNDNANRGPRGYDEYNRTSTSGNFGWPYVIADNRAYVDYNFANSTSGVVFDPNNLVNNSPNNTGMTNLPDAIPAWISYPYEVNPDRPELGNGGRAAMAGEYYKYNASNTSRVGFPEYYDNTLFIMEWSRNWIKEVRFDENGNLLQINPVKEDLIRPIDMHFGPDGALYVIEWGTGFSGGNDDARIIKIEYNSSLTNSAPNAVATASINNGQAPLSVNFFGNESNDADVGDVLSYAWDFNGDGITDTSTENANFVFNTNGEYIATLTVSDQEGLTSVAQVNIIVGNTAPIVSIDFPLNGGFFKEEETIRYKVSVVDEEDGSILDGSIDCLDVVVEPSIGHDDHSHGTGPIDNCEGEFITQTHGDGPDNIFYVFSADYTDLGGDVNVPLRGRTVSVLQTKTKQAEHFQGISDARVENTSDFMGGGGNVGFINDGSYLSYTPMNFESINYMTIRWAALNKESIMEVHIDAPDGPIIAKRRLPITGGWQDYDYFTTTIDNPGGAHEVFVVFTRPEGGNSLGNVNWYEFHGKGISVEDFQKNKGLKASYYPTNDFTGSPIIRKDPMISFDWDMESPGASIPEDGFSVRWEGQLIGQRNGAYTLSLDKKNGPATVWLNDAIIMSGTDLTESITLTQGQLYKIVIEYAHTTGEAAIKLNWEGANPVNTIHTEFLRLNEEDVLSTPDVENNVSSIFPNPVNNILRFSENLKGKSYKIYNVLGKMVTEGTFKESIDTSILSKGLYLLRVEDKEVIKLIKS